jgi:hypothetical protein
MKEATLIMRSGTVVRWPVESIRITTDPLTLRDTVSWMGVEGQAQLLYLEMTHVAAILVTPEGSNDRSDQEGSVGTATVIPRVNEPG